MVTTAARGIGIKMGTMGKWRNSAIVVLLGGLALGVSLGVSQAQDSGQRQRFVASSASDSLRAGCGGGTAGGACPHLNPRRVRGSDDERSLRAPASMGQVPEAQILRAQAPAARSGPVLSRTTLDGAGGRGRKSAQALSSADRRAVIASALHSKTPRTAERDCSHLVHAVYRRAGFPYAYATSDDLYDGVEGFQRVSRPKPGDLVVWRGHVGIVIRPSQHAFFSFLHAGPGIDDYENRYWIGRGQPRFYRYVKNAACAGCTLARGRASE